MSNHAVPRGQEPLTEIDPVEGAAQFYLHETEGNPSVALRLAVTDMLALNHLPTLIAEGVSWGFLRRAKSELVGSEPG